MLLNSCPLNTDCHAVAFMPAAALSATTTADLMVCAASARAGVVLTVNTTAQVLVLRAVSSHVMGVMQASASTGFNKAASLIQMTAMATGEVTALRNIVGVATSSVLVSAVAASGVRVQGSAQVVVSALARMRQAVGLRGVVAKGVAQGVANLRQTLGARTSVSLRLHASMSGLRGIAGKAATGSAASAEAVICRLMPVSSVVLCSLGAIAVATRLNKSRQRAVLPKVRETVPNVPVVDSEQRHLAVELNQQPKQVVRATRMLRRVAV